MCTKGSAVEPTVLVVDDEPQIGRLIARILWPEFSVNATTRVGDAVRMLEAGQRFDVILCDVIMPEMDGYAFLEHVERLDRVQAKRVALMTVFPQSQELYDGVPRVPDLLEKPFRMAEIRGLVRARASIRPEPEP
jgi:CheY-like chemotaxis protein